jgi:hypothetical protein
MMVGWIGAFLLIACLAAVIPLAALAGKGAGKRVRGNLQLAAILLGFGEPLDPPSKHLAEAGDRDESESPAPGEPPTPGA